LSDIVRGEGQDGSVGVVGMEGEEFATICCTGAEEGTCSDALLLLSIFTSVAEDAAALAESDLSRATPRVGMAGIGPGVRLRMILVTVIVSPFEGCTRGGGG